MNREHQICNLPQMQDWAWGTFHHWSARRAWILIESAAIQPDRMTTHRFPYTRAPAAFHLLHDHPTKPSASSSTGTSTPASPPNVSSPRPAGPYERHDCLQVGADMRSGDEGPLDSLTELLHVLNNTREAAGADRQVDLPR